MHRSVAPGPLEFYRSRFEIENNLTRNVFKAIPSDSLDYRPHKRSSSTGQIIWTIVRGLYVRADMASQGASDIIPDPHPDLAEMFERFEDVSSRHTAHLDSLSGEQWSGVGQLRVGDRVALELPVSDIVWLFHFDEIHHRGQLSTYLRPIGAKVPSIYGASGDSDLP
jgi:uncharacterized damage-inducible protein DinB